MKTLEPNHIYTFKLTTGGTIRVGKFHPRIYHFRAPHTHSDKSTGPADDARSVFRQS